MDFPKDIDPMRFFMAMLAISLSKKDRAEAEAIIKIEPVSSPPETAVKALQCGIDEIQRLLGYAPHLKDGEKVSFTITASHTNSTGTKTQAYSYQLTKTV